MKSDFFKYQAQTSPNPLALEIKKAKGSYIYDISNKKYLDLVHDVWTKHLFNNLPFEQFGKNFEKTSDKPHFLAIDTSRFR